MPAASKSAIAVASVASPNAIEDAEDGKLEAVAATPQLNHALCRVGSWIYFAPTTDIYNYDVEQKQCV